MPFRPHWFHLRIPAGVADVAVFFGAFVVLAAMAGTVAGLIPWS